MPQSSDSARQTGVSPQTDKLAATLLGEALDVLADGSELGVILAVQDSSGVVASYEFVDDGPEACLDGARTRVSATPDSVRYAIAYEGAVADDKGSYSDAVLLEFGERGYRAYSAFSLIDGKGSGDGFTWTDPAPAGEMEPLL